MGTSPDSRPENPKKGDDVVMGYPNQSQQMYPSPPPQPTEPPPPPPSSTTTYPQYPNPYQPYPYQPYPYSQPPYNDYYYQQYCRQESESSANLGRILLILMLLLVSSILTMTLIMWFLFGASVPEFSIASIIVSNFSATPTSFSGIWSVSLSVSNVNMELDVRFDRGVSTIIYKDSMLGVAPMEPFEVKKSQQLGLNLTVPSLRDQSWVPPTLAADRSSGVVVVSLRLAVDTNFTAPDVVYRQQRLRVLCEDLPISFASTSGEGTLGPNFGNHCFIRLRD
ncbi:uncharacterized protein LOC130998482 [Salvia miltiorrhiza]|uniref:uncharacterized protein LOC130998482 n=1 Tax=Salvia miltiorrhiza TaxID=226208 RepID=UPI0025ABE91E|nr:uncharacterized protein LOC130998482 [Salvia miltiorrhiza]